MEIIQTLRKERGWSMQRLAEACDPPATASQINKIEKGAQRVTVDWLERLAHAFEVPLSTLLGAEVPMARLVGHVSAGDGSIAYENLWEAPEEIEAPPGHQGEAAVRVRGDRMQPRYADGDILFFSRKAGLDIANCLHRDCIVRLSTGETLLKRLEEGSKMGCFTLRPLNPTHRPMLDVPVDWLAPVTWIKPG